MVLLCTTAFAATPQTSKAATGGAQVPALQNVKSTGPVGAFAEPAPIYRLGAGDVISITVEGHDEWSLQVQVRPDGRITYPATGEIDVSGMTIAQLTDKITAALGPVGHHLINPEVTINVVGFKPSLAYVLGAVTTPGTVTLPRGVATAKKVLSMVGGAQPQADLTQVTLYREDGTRESIDLKAEVAGTKQDTPIYAGDVLVVSQTEQRFVGVLGSAAKNGQIPLPPGQDTIDLATLVLQAGGINPDADTKRALILRAGGAVDQIPLEKVLMRQAPPVTLAGGDILWVLPQPQTTYFSVMGAVTTPGRFEYRDGLTLADAMALAGQTSPAANVRDVMLLHEDGSKETVDIRPMLNGQSDAVARLPIRPDDIVLVPIQDKSYVMLGAVGKPGIFPWEENTKLADALAKAGGPVEGVADLQHAVLVRRTAEGKQPIVMELDVAGLLQGRNEAANWTLQPGDTVYIPAKQEKSWAQRLQTPMFLLGLVTTLTNLLHR